MNGYPPGFLERHLPGLRTPASRAHQQEALVRGARMLDPNAMDRACAKGAMMNPIVVNVLVEASERGHVDPLRMVECIRCAVRWNANLLSADRMGTSAAIRLLKSMKNNTGAVRQAASLVEHRWHGMMARVEGKSVMMSEALAPFKADKPSRAKEHQSEDTAKSSTPVRTPKP